jgi:hypothetical protein
VEFLDLKVIEGDIIQQVEEAMAFVRRNTSMAAKIEGKLERTERWEYPPDAVREAINNAVCHRDYADSAYSGGCRTLIPISVGQGSDFCRTPFRFISDSVPG